MISRPLRLAMQMLPRVFFALSLLLPIAIPTYPATISNNGPDRPLPDYPGIALKAITIMPLYYQRGCLDSLFSAFDSWKEKSGIRRVDPRLLVLVSIASKKFDESLRRYRFFYPDLRHRDDYQRFAQSVGKDTTRQSYILKKAYDAFLIKFAGDLLINQKPNSVEALLCLYYSGKNDEFYNELLFNEAYRYSLLRIMYDQEIKSISYKMQSHKALYAGIFCADR